jgi:ribosome-binding ATPase YchF (GTP1/OBG family)
MKIGIMGTDIFSQGKANLVDERIKTLKQMFNSAKEVYIQVDIVIDEGKIFETDGIICPENKKLDIVVSDMEFVETRLGRSGDDAEKGLLNRFKEHLDREGLLFELSLTEEEKKIISGYSLLSIRPVLLALAQDLENKEKLLLKAYAFFGYISFFTAGDKDAHGWSIKKGATAWDAAGAIHSDIQKGFIRAEAASYQDLIADGGLSKARSNNHLRLEMKEYVVQDGDYLLIRTNK